MQYPQTRYQDTLAVGITSAQLNCQAGLNPPTRTQGILTLGRLQSNTEDIYFTNVVGNIITIGLRGLSQTALTPTSITGNQLVHNANESLEITTHHNYDTNLLRKDENDTVTGAITYQSGLLTPYLLDINGNKTLLTPATTNAVNGVTLTNAATGNNPTLSATGTDTNINLQLSGQGIGTVIVPNGSQNVSSSAPTAPAQLANKAYVDAQIASISTKPQAVYAPTDQIVTDTVSSGDITANNNLLYFSGGTWHKVTSVVSTWYNVPLGICLTPVTGGNSGATILLQGEYTGMTFLNINPTFSSSVTGTPNPVGTVAQQLVAGVIDNSAGAEAIATGSITISGYKNGSPSGALGIGIVAAGQDQTGAPACYFDTTNNTIRGAIIAQTSIAAINFSGVFQNLTASFGGTFKIPAATKLYIVFWLNGSQSNTNFYEIQAGGTTLSLASSTMTWSGSSLPVNYTLPVTSTSPVGYSVKAYTGTSGSYGLTNHSPWARIIGAVYASGSMYFQPNQGNRNVVSGGHLIAATAVTPTAIDTLTLGFCPNEVDVVTSSANIASANILMQGIGYIRGDNILGSAVPITLGSSAPAPASYLGGFPSSDASTTVGMQVNAASITSGIPASTQNYFHVIRLENGLYSYIGYPGASTFVSAGTTGFASLRYGYQLTARA